MGNKKVIVLSVAVIIGLALGSAILGRALQRFKTQDRFISVKGFSEREVKSDLVVWTIKTRVAYNDLGEGSKAIEEAKNKVIDFLTRNNDYFGQTVQCNSEQSVQ